MKVSIPLYLNGKEVRNIKTDEIDCVDLTLDDYIVRIQTLDDINILIKDFKHATEYEELIQKIQNENKLLRVIKDKQIRFSKDLKRAKEDVPQIVIDKLQPEIDIFMRHIKQTNERSMIYLKENIEEIKQYFQSIITDKKEKLKQRNREASKRYYEKHKKDLSVCIIPTTPEEEDAKIQERIEKRKQRNREASKRNYEKYKKDLSVYVNQLTPEEEQIRIQERIEKKKQAQREANKKYYLKIKQENLSIQEPQPEKPIQTEAEKRKVWNKKYYQSKKELLAQLAVLSSGDKQI